MTETLKARIEALAGGQSAKLDDLLEALERAGYASAVQDITLDLADAGEAEAVEIIRANY